MQWKAPLQNVCVLGPKSRASMDQTEDKSGQKTLGQSKNTPPAAPPGNRKTLHQLQPRAINQVNTPGRKALYRLHPRAINQVKTPG